MLREDETKQNELYGVCVVRRKSEAEGVPEVKWGPASSSPPPLNSDWERPGRGMAAPSPSSSVSYSARHPLPHLCSDAGIREVGRVPGLWSWGALGLGAGSAKGGYWDVSGGVCVRA